MTQVILENELKQNNLQSLYLLYGEEKYLLENVVKKIKKIFGELVLGINYIQINILHFLFHITSSKNTTFP